MSETRQNMVSVDSTHPAHADMFKTLVLLKLSDSDIYIIVESCSKYCDDAELQENDSYFYEESTCLVNFLRVEAVFTPDDDDPHGLFDHIRTIWMPQGYDRHGAWLREAFPETREKTYESATPIPSREKDTR